MKKKILFVIDSLDIAGAEKSLVTLLNVLDYSKFSVDLQLFAYGYQLEKLLPNEVNILKPLKYTKFAKLSLKKSLQHTIVKGEYRMLMARIKYSIKIRKKNNSNPEKAIVYWKCMANVINRNPKQYDIAISYAQGVPTYYVADKITAHKKLAWVNVTYSPNDKVKVFQSEYYDQFNQIVAVSETAKEVYLNTFPLYEDKVSIVYDISNPNFISEMAEIGNSYEDEFDGIRILTIGRLAYQKGYDIALETCKQLKKKGVNFKWYVLGKGPLQREIEKAVKEMGLSKYFILLGVKDNPYPYIKNAHIYVQTSRFEGFGLAIAEARMLNIPVVTTKFDVVYDQMVHEENGLVVDHNAIEVTNAIIRLINDEKLRTKITNYLGMEKKGNLEEIDNFYHLIN